MGSWYRCIKKIKGIRYLYLQTSWRESGKVRTRGHSLGPSGTELQVTIRAVVAKPVCAAGDDVRSIVRPVNTTTIIAYHGARNGFRGEPRPSKSGNLGPGFYLAAKKRAELSAKHDPKWATKAIDLDEDGLEPQYDGDVVCFDLSRLKMLVVPHWDAWVELVEKVGESGKLDFSKENLLSVQEGLEEAGYDGIDARNLVVREDEIVVFASSLHKVRELDEAC
jgi:hypothetical protein